MTQTGDSFEKLDVWQRAQALNYIAPAAAGRLIDELKEISRMLHGLHKKPSPPPAP
ncbi:MAG: hypothetical protein LBC18_08030 [Opitutaceae bacterium]|nr:hypothetical protein [Opitutaceae bacterium]